MYAKEIREMAIQGRGNGRGGSLDLDGFDALRFMARLLQEGVAQLAELNATLREEVDPNVFVDMKDPFKNLASAKPAQDEWKCNCENPTKFADICSYCRGKLL